MWTDHKNLEYIRASNALKPGGLSVLIVSTSPLIQTCSSENAKPDALSRLPDPNYNSEIPSYTHPVISWGVKKKVWKANANLQVLARSPRSGCPCSSAFLGNSLGTSLVYCHPGLKQTIFISKQHFWWLSMEKEVGEYLPAKCARNKEPSGASTSYILYMGRVHAQQLTLLCF